MDDIIRQRLGVIGRRVEDRMESCKRILEELKGEGSQVEGGDLERNQLKSSLNLLSEDIKSALQTEKCSQKTRKLLTKLTLVQLNATDVLTQLETKLREAIANQTAEVKGDAHHCHSEPARLPVLEVGKFGGNVLEWQEFWDTYTSVIQKKNLTDSYKLLYLKSLLKDEARSVIEGLPCTNANYAIAVERLKERYAQPERNVDAHVRAINHLPQASNEISDCRKTLLTIEKHLAILESLGENTNDNLLRATILDKFPDFIVQDLRFKTSTVDCSLNQLRQYLDQIISARETTSSKPTASMTLGQPSSFTTESLFTSQNSGKPKAVGPRGTIKFQRQTNRGRRPQTAYHNRITVTADTANHDDNKRKGSHQSCHTEQQNKKPRLSCFFCGGAHYSSDCKTYPTIQQRKEKAKGHCYRCLRSGHIFSQCKVQGSCGYCRKQDHHRFFCPSKFDAKPTSTVSSSNFSSSANSTVLPTAVATVFGRSGLSVRCRLLLDTGSQRSYVTREAATRLGLISSGQPSLLTIYSFGNPKPQQIQSSLIQLRFKGVSSVVEASLYIVPTTTGSLPTFLEIKTTLAKQHPALPFALDSTSDCPADVIIGNDYYHVFVTGERVKVGANLFLINTLFGWVVSGLVSERSTGDELSFLTYVNTTGMTKVFCPPDQTLNRDSVQDLWDLEIIGIKDTPKMLQDEDVVQYFNSTTQRINGRYFVKWPWVVYPPDLPLNFGPCIGRLRSLLKNATPEILHNYDAVLKEQLEKGIIEEVKEDKLPTSHPVHYLPHHCVIQENRSTKLRIVYDGSAKVHGHNSLNEVLYKGPSLLEDLTSMLIQFRQHSVGIISDIEKAFLMIGLQMPDRDVTRFLWVKDLSKEPVDGNLLHLRFQRVPFGVISSPFLLAATINLHLTKANTAMSQQLSRHLYVDNLVTGSDTSEDAFSLYKEARCLFSELSMNIRQWNSNDTRFLNLIPETHRSQKTTESVLGIRWSTTHDTLTFGVTPAVLEQPASTKRQVLKIIASVFDPCGWVAPFTLPTRVFLQSLWVDKLKWDSPLLDKHHQQWAACTPFLQAIPSIVVPRHYFRGANGPSKGTAYNELHCFVDASKVAYVAAVYLRSNVQGKYLSSLVISKSRLTPLKHRDTFTVPKLELLALLIGARLVRYVEDSMSLTFTNITVWSDSTIALSWLKADKLLPPFVSRRVTELRSHSHVQFRHVPTRHNPADIATRPLENPIMPDAWLFGPHFLTLPSDQWLSCGIQPASPHHLPTNMDESSLVFASNPISTPPASVSVDHHRLDSRVSPPASPDPDSDLLPVTTVQVEAATIRVLQQRHFPLESDKRVTPLSKSLGLYMDEDGLLRCKGRFANAAFPLDQKFPILLPKRSSFTEGLIKLVHIENFHVGVSHTLSLLRSRYWVPQGRAKVSSVLRRCSQCIKHGGGPYQLPQMPDLPGERVSYNHPFTHTGLDYLGPLTVLEHDIPVKRYCCLFTCMATRAVHLELVPDLTAEEFLLCLRRFVAARGTPKLLVSDNATHFTLAADLLASPYVRGLQLTWKFIPSLSPWQGGFYERLVALVKHCLYRSLGETMLQNNQLWTVLKEIEATLNSRPLTTVGKDVELILTPAHFLRTCGPAIMEFDQDALAPVPTTAVRDRVINSWTRTSRLLRFFRSMFISQYLLSLREHHRFDHTQTRVLSLQTPAVGAYVQLKGDSNNRTHWKVGKITALGSSADGQIRTAQVTLPCGTVLTRSLCHLYPLELDISPSPTNTTNHDASTQQSTNRSPSPSPRPTTDAAEEITPQQNAIIPPATGPGSDRPRRSSALAARDRIRDWVAALFTAAITSGL